MKKRIYIEKFLFLSLAHIHTLKDFYDTKVFKNFISFLPTKKKNGSFEKNINTDILIY